MPGEEYLEKIVQAPFELPLPDKVALRGLLTEQLDKFLDGTPDNLFDAGHWSSVYFEGMDEYMQTPRDVVRPVNTLQVTYPSVIGEVNAVDFFAIEALRVFEPAVYDIIRRNPSYFAGRAESSSYGPLSQNQLREFHNAWVTQQGSEDQENLK